MGSSQGVLDPHRGVVDATEGQTSRTPDVRDDRKLVVHRCDQNLVAIDHVWFSLGDLGDECDDVLARARHIAPTGRRLPRFDVRVNPDVVAKLVDDGILNPIGEGVSLVE